MQIRDSFLTAAAAAFFVPFGAALAQAPAPVSPAAPPVVAAPAAVSAPAGVQSPVPDAAAGLPQAPSAVLSAQGAGLSRGPGQNTRYVPAATAPGPGGFPVEKAVDGPLPLSLGDAISLGLERNYRLRYQHANQRTVQGYRGLISNALLPDLRFRAASSAQEIDLAAQGFSPSKTGGLLKSFGITNIPTIVKVNTTSAQLSVDQVLFNMPDFELYRAIKPEFKAVDLNVADTNEQLVQAVANAYLRVLADRATLNNAIAQEEAARALLDQATQMEQAGVGIKLDVLRAQVDYQQRQQVHVSAAAQLDKDGIQLNRIMGIPAGQQLELTDQAPFSELTDLDLERAKQTAYARRSDLLALQQSIVVAQHEVKAVRYQRLPTLAVNGFYGVLGEDGGLFHGVFTAQGSLKVPIFREAGQRGEQETVESQLMQLRDQESNLKGTIEAQLRTSLLDINSTDQLVKVSQSNVELAQQALSDARDRFKAGVTDNLEAINAQAALISAQAQLVNALFQFNVAKIGLARSTGVLQTQYRSFLGM